MREEGVRKAELARRLDCHKPQIDQLPDMRRSSQLDQLDPAFAALNRRVTTRVGPA